MTMGSNASHIYSRHRDITPIYGDFRFCSNTTEIIHNSNKGQPVLHNDIYIIR